MKKSLLLLAAVCVLLATGAAASAASPSAYRAKVNGICKVGVAKINAVPKPTSGQGYAAYLDTETKLSVQLLKQIIAVTPPKSLQPAVLAALKLQGKLVDAVIVVRDKIKNGADPVKTLKAATPALDKINNQANAAWRKAGLNACTG